MDQIRAGFGELNGLADKIERTATEVEHELDDLESQIRLLTETWTGAASEAFQEVVTRWLAAAADLRQSLRRLAAIVRTTHANYHSALTTNLRMWPTR